MSITEGQPIIGRKGIEMRYRDEIKNAIVIAEQEDVDITEFLLFDDVSACLNRIESDVNEIFDKLREIKGLTEIDEINDMLKELSDKLY